MSAATRPASRLRPVPDRNEDLAHLDLPALRVYRGALSAEESRVSYWRRLVQARLDLLRAQAEGASLTVDAASRVLAGPRVGAGRKALLAIVPQDDMPPLPDLQALWRLVPAPEDRAGLARVVARLAAAERELSDYRAALHRRMDAATGELIARYREEPTLCLTALPQPREVALPSVSAG